jgi:hypothetical protein
MYQIFVDSLVDLAIVCAQLVREGICFEAHSDGSRWVVLPTGGF